MFSNSCLCSMRSSCQQTHFLGLFGRKMRCSSLVSQTLLEFEFLSDRPWSYASTERFLIDKGPNSKSDQLAAQVKDLTVVYHTEAFHECDPMQCSLAERRFPRDLIFHLTTKLRHIPRFSRSAPYVNMGRFMLDSHREADMIITFSM
jgi:hypothetical protein